MFSLGCRAGSQQLLQPIFTENERPIMFLMFGLVGVFPWEIDKSVQSLELEMAGDMTFFGARF